MIELVAFEYWVKRLEERGDNFGGRDGECDRKFIQESDLSQLSVDFLKRRCFLVVAEK